MRYIQIGEKTVAVYSEHYRERNQKKNQDRCLKRGKNNRSNMNSFRRQYINKKSKQNIPTNEVNKNTANKNISSGNHQEPSTNPSRTPLEVFVEAIRNLQKIMTEDINFTSR